MLTRLESKLHHLAGHRRLVILLAAVTPLILRGLVLPLLPVPQPRVQDEFSHLLVADTFAHGRLVNPTHPMAVHFESMHMLVTPVYGSAFPVAPGLAMAAGQLLIGHPWAGVWLAIAFMSGALCWMLYGWLPARWALAGAAVAVIRFTVLSYWMNSYYGGAMAAAGGALVLGALPRLQRRRRWQDAALMAAGFAILANSRPYEGVVFGIPLLAALVWTMVGQAVSSAGKRRSLLRVAVPLLLILTVTAAAMAIYNFRFSGNPLQLPYAFYRATFTMAPHFIFQSPRPEPLYHHRVLHDFHVGWEMNCYREARGNLPPRGFLQKAVSYWRFFLGPFLSVPLLALPWLWKRRRTRFLLLLAALMLPALLVEVWHAPHYAAPATGLALLLAFEGFRHLRIRAGRWPVRVLLAACFLTPVIGGSPWVEGGAARARIVEQLSATPGRHLILVRYTRTHDVGDEWVYNAARIDSAPIVWAREMDPTSNQEIVRYFNDRRVWLVQPDRQPPLLTPWDPANAPDPPFRFVKLGTDAITVLRSVDEVRRKIPHAGQALSCDRWNFLFEQATGVEAPDPHGCYSPAPRAQLVTFDHWFTWLVSQR